MSKILKGKIEGYGYDGEGVCRVDGKVCFIPFAIKGEIVEFEVAKETSSFNRGRLLNIIQESNLRQKPPCPYYQKCGGCTYQHISHDDELEIKKDLLKGQLVKVGFKEEIDVIKSQEEYFYRNKLKVFVDNGKIGLKIRNSDKICDIEKCLISKDIINDALLKVRTFVKAQNLYNFINEIVFRCENDSCIINFILSKYKKINYQGLQLMLGINFGIYQTYNGKSEHQLGKEFLEVKEFGLNCEFSPNTFHQINDGEASELYSTLIKSIVGDKILNCYSGAGVLSGIIAKENKWVSGVELGINEHNDAEKLKEQNNLFYLRNILGDCSEVIPQLEDDFKTIIVDPPRTGLDKKVSQILNEKACNRFIYVSCNSATLIRDIARLDNFKIKSITIYDMFPRTGEYEVLAILDK